MTQIKDTIKKPEISFWVGLLLPVIGLAVAWGIMTNRMTNLETRFNYFGDRQAAQQEECEIRFREQDMVFLEIQVTLAEIQKDIQFLIDSR